MRNIKTAIIPVFLFGLLIVSQSCADQKKAAEDRADTMNESTKAARENPDNDPDEPVSMNQTTGAHEAVDDSKFNQQGKNELNEVAQQAPMGDQQRVGGAPMDPEASIMDNISSAPNLSTLVKALNAAGLTRTLNGSGPFTILAPANSAFDQLSSGSVEELLNSDNKTALQQLLKNHVIAGDKKASDIIVAINRGNGETRIRTLGGQSLIAKLQGEQIIIEDSQGHKATVINPDLEQSNGRVHIIDAVLPAGS